jgi:peptide/nickel transport system permease protein
MTDPATTRTVPARGVGMRAILADRWAFTGAVTIVVLVLVALGADLLTALEGQDLEPDIGNLGPTGVPVGPLGGISAEHWFGVEPLTGRDLFAVVVHGARTSLLIGLATTAVSVLLGVLLGAAAGYLGGWWDRVITPVADPAAQRLRREEWRRLEAG